MHTHICIYNGQEIFTEPLLLSQLLYCPQRLDRTDAASRTRGSKTAEHPHPPIMGASNLSCLQKRVTVPAAESFVQTLRQPIEDGRGQEMGLAYGRTGVESRVQSLGELGLLPWLPLGR